MRRQIVWLVGIALVLAIAVSPQLPAGAQTDSPCDDQHCRRRGGIDPGGKTIHAEGGAVIPGSGGVPVPTGSSYLADCNWSMALEGETRDLHPIAGAWTVTFEEDSWLVWCAPQLIVYTYFAVGDPPPPYVVDDMIVDAYERTPVLFFEPLTSPDGSETIPFVTQMPTYLWVDEELWQQPVTATAELPGIFSVTTTAVPAETTWTGGDDPATVICEAGTPYRFGIGGDDAQDQSCSTVFAHSSATEEHSVTVTVRWDVSFTCSAVCGGPLPPIFTTTSRDVIVAEIQAIES